MSSSVTLTISEVEGSIRQLQAEVAEAVHESVPEPPPPRQDVTGTEEEASSIQPKLLPEARAEELPETTKRRWEKRKAAERAWRIDPRAQVPGLEATEDPPPAYPPAIDPTQELTGPRIFRKSTTRRALLKTTNYKLRATYLRGLENALERGDAGAVEAWYVRFSDAHRELVPWNERQLPPALHLSKEQLSKMLSLWAQRPESRLATMHEEEEGAEEQGDDSREYERGAKRALALCRTLLEEIDTALQKPVSLENDPLRILESSQGILRDILLQPLSPGAEETNLDRLVLLATRRSRSTSPAHIVEALDMVNLAFPRPSRKVRRKQVRAMEALDAGVPLPQPTPAPFFGPRLYWLLMDAVARSTPRPTSVEQSTPGEVAWMLKGVRHLLDMKGQDRGMTDEICFRTMRTLVYSWRPGSWRPEKALAIMRPLYEQLQRLEERPSTQTYSSLLTFAMRSRTLPAIPLIVRQALEHGKLDTGLINNMLAGLLTTKPRLEDPQTRVETRSTKRRGLRAAPLIDSPRAEIAMVKAVYEAMRDNLIANERDRFRKPQSQSLVRQAQDFKAFDDPLSALAIVKDDVPAPANPTAAQQHLLNNLGIMRLPTSVIPDATTYYLVIKRLAWQGDLHGAIAVLEDMVHTPLDAGRVEADADATDGPTFMPNVTIYDALFRGFARHGCPARSYELDTENPSQSTWYGDLDTDYAEEPDFSSEWHVYAFCEVFEAFLKLRAARRTSVAPSYNSFFWLLTALRRVSADHAQWVLLQWERAWAKFSRVAWQDMAQEVLQERARGGTAGNPRARVRVKDARRQRGETPPLARAWRHDGDEWIGAVINARVVRILLYLQEREQQQG